MATTLVTTLYPPIVPDSMPAFIRTGSCRIYFSLSSYNQAADIKNVQISLVRQKTNQSAFNQTKYPSGIKITSLTLDDTKQDNYNYYVQISSDDVENGSFELDQFYKVQLRFTSIQASDLDPPFEEDAGIDSWLIENIDYFSEWSTVCLIRGISYSNLQLNNLHSGNLNVLTKRLSNIIGEVSFYEPEETEYFKSYNIKIYSATEPIIPQQLQFKNSPWRFKNTLTSFNGQLPLHFTFRNESSTLFESLIGEKDIDQNFKLFYKWNNSQISPFKVYQNKWILPTEQTDFQDIRIKDQEIPEETKQWFLNNAILRTNDSNPIQLVFDSGDIYIDANTPGKIDYDFNYELNDDSSYILEVKCITNNLFTLSQTFRLFTSYNPNQLLNANISVKTNNDNGLMKVQVDFYDTDYSPRKDLIIKRTSSKFDFKQWENLKTIPFESIVEKGFVWYDSSVENGVWYKYRIQQDDDEGKMIDSEQTLMCIFEDMFLTTGERQLKVQLNPTVSNFKYNVTESQQVTLGSQFPFIKRNGDNYFRTFSIGGLISSLIDIDEWYNNLSYCETTIDEEDLFNFTEPFTSKQQIYKNSKQLYNQYNKSNNVNYFYDNIYERNFRQKVMDFLYKNNIKLWRSATQGNILIKLMDINLQPVNELGRLLYSFTANAIEIAVPNAENYKKYNVINNKYYICEKRTFVQYFKPMESVFKVINNSIRTYNNTTDAIEILKLKMTSLVDNAVLYTQQTKQDELIRTLIQSNNVIQLSNYDNYFAYYFNGRHSDDTLPDTGYYADFPTSSSDNQKNAIYHIVTNRRNIVYIYIDQDGSVLITSPDGVIENNKSLLTQEEYELYNYTDDFGEGSTENPYDWYPFDINNNDTILPIKTQVTCYYVIKKEG